MHPGRILCIRAPSGTGSIEAQIQAQSPSGTTPPRVRVVPPLFLSLISSAIFNSYLSTMIPTRLTVRPKLPTALHGESSVKLPGFDLWMHYVSFAELVGQTPKLIPSPQIENVFVIPTRLDVARFKAALSDTLQLYPHAAGHLVRCGEEWQVRIARLGGGKALQSVGSDRSIDRIVQCGRTSRNCRNRECVSGD